MRHHPARTRRTRILHVPTRQGQLSRPATLVLGLAIVLTMLFLVSL